MHKVVLLAIIFMQAQNPGREDMKLREDMKQEMMVCVLYDSFNKAFKHALTYRYPL